MPYSLEQKARACSTREPGRIKRLLGDRLLVKPPVAVEKSEGGIILGGKPRYTNDLGNPNWRVGEVLDIGFPIHGEDAGHPDLVIGQKILYESGAENFDQKNYCTEEFDGEPFGYPHKLIIMSVNRVLGIVE